VITHPLVHLLYAVGSLIQFSLPVFVPVVVTGLGWMWLSYALLSQRKGTVAAEPPPAVR
jgi:hypothetical protein